MEILSRISTKYFKFALVTGWLKLMIDAPPLGWQVVGLRCNKPYDNIKNSV